MNAQDLETKFTEWVNANGGTVDNQLNDVAYSVATFKTTDGKTFAVVFGEDTEVAQ